jgi:hypothetical protein
MNNARNWLFCTNRITVYHRSSTNFYCNFKPCIGTVENIFIENVKFRPLGWDRHFYSVRKYEPEDIINKACILYIYFEIKCEIRLDHSYFKVEMGILYLVWDIAMPVYHENKSAKQSLCFKKQILRFWNWSQDKTWNFWSEDDIFVRKIFLTWLEGSTHACTTQSRGVGSGSIPYLCQVHLCM